MSSQDPKDRRRYVRLATDDAVRCSIEGAEVVHVVGLSSGGNGMRVIVDRELPDTSEFAVTMDIDDSQPTIQARGRVVWQEAWDFGFCNRFVAGVEFVRIDDSARERLVGLIPEKKDRQPLQGDEI